MPIQMAKIEVRNTPEANSGTEVVTMLKSEIERSSRELSRMPAETPSRIDMGTMTAKARLASTSVLPSRFQMMLLTSVL